MKILIIGGSGMLAKPVAEHLYNAGFQIRLFSRYIDPAQFNFVFETLKGDVFNPADLEKAIDGCDAIHISLSKVNEALATRKIVEVATLKQVKLISIITGCTVAEENRWFPMIEGKYQAEQTIINSGIPFLIFRPTWFFESLELMIRNGKATMIGKQPNPYRWVAAADYAQMVANAYQKPEAWRRIFYVFGPEQYRMTDLLVIYCQRRHPEIKKVSSVPLGLIKLIAFLTGKHELKSAASMFDYFEKVKEMGDPTEANILLGKPQTTFDKWLDSKG
jgi:uncharacterized protein YbjT (DUF2867 family)